MFTLFSRKITVFLTAAVLASALLTACGIPGASTAQSAPAAISQAEASSAVAESNTTEINVDLGQMDGNLYTNASLGLSMEVPEGWYSLDEEQRLEILKAGAELITSDSNKIDLSMQRTLPLIASFETDPALGQAPNPNIQLMAEKMSILASALVKNEDQYIDVVQKQLEGITEIQGVAASYSIGEREDVEINGRTFRKISVQLEGADGTVYVMQDYLVYFHNSYAFSVVSSYVSEENHEVLNKCIQTLTIA